MSILSLDQTEIAFEDTGGTIKIKLTANGSWETDNIPNWVSLDYESGDTSQEITITIDVNKETKKGQRRVAERDTSSSKQNSATRWRQEKKILSVDGLLETLLLVLNSFTAGNPMDCSVLWTNLTLREIQEKLRSHSISVSCPVIKKMLKACHFVKRKMRKCKTLKEVENRNEQFEYIAQLKKQFIENNLPILSIDTKKKEMIGNFYRDGKVFCKEAIRVNDHDFNSFSQGFAVPHGIYDVARNICYLSIGTNKDTAEFMMENIDYHWRNSIKKNYPRAKRMLILCDGGGSNSSSHYVVKEQFKQLAVKLQMEIVVAHYPAYCSKWNPIEHRAFSYISKRWQGVVFDNYEIIKELAEQTTTKTGFSVKAYINTKKYQTGKKASDEFRKTMPVIFNDFLPKWNYKFVY